MTPYSEEELTALGKRRKRAMAEISALRPALTAQIIAAGRAGVPQVDVVAKTGITRDQVRKIWRKAGIEAT